MLERMMVPKRGDFSPELARYILTLDFPPPAHKRYNHLSRRVQADRLSRDEIAELDGYLLASSFLGILQSKARMSLKRRGRAA